MTTMKLHLLTTILLALSLASCGQEDSKSSTATQTEVVSKTETEYKPTAIGPDITLDVLERDFGTIWDFESVTTTFPFTNTGTKTLVLSRLQAGCGCTTPIADKTVLQPGESGTITVTFDPKGKANKQDKKVTIFSNSVNNPEIAFWIRSYVNQFVDVKNKFLKLNEMKLGESHSVEFDFFPSDSNFEIITMNGTGKHGQYISGKELDTPQGAPRRIQINVSPDMPWGSFHSQLEVSGKGKTPDGKAMDHKFTVFANGHTYGKIRADKHIMSVGTLRAGGSYNIKNRIYRPDGEPFKILNTAILQPTVSGINATPIQNLDGSYEIVVSGTLPASHSGPVNAELMIQTNVPGEEVLKFRIAGVVPKR